MPSSAHWIVFLTVMCASVLRSSAFVSEFASDGGPGGGGGGGDDALVAAVDRNIRAASEAMVAVLSSTLNTMKAELSAQIESVQEDLAAQLDRLESRLMTRVQRVAAQLDDVTSQMTSQVRDTQTALTTQNTDLSARLQDSQGQLEGMLDVVADGLFHRLVDVQSQMLTALLTPRDCSDLPASAKSGIYLLWPSPDRAVPGYCDLETDGGGWTVIQRRADIKPRTQFDLTWESYGRGFGAPLGEFWWGNENLFRLTSIQGRHYELLVELEDAEGTRKTASYHTFRISEAMKGYSLTVSGYSGDAGDSLTSSSGQAFSTKDRDRDASEDNCAALWEAGWWYGACPHSNLNGPYLSHTNSSSLYGVVWPAWLQATSLKSAEMKIRPTEPPTSGAAREP